ncbi:YqaE/Pmp3 family membrane protein [Lishizhenia sp.]|uniref:YqaE/Pmp3 family membrane protein n=1 Tax=Lishizhenia sp. TaxID=2497594 RepID=UPI00299DE11C|nr:YqaE/Pmp3 family membrane protein [Lishizhenia sp.]MDX1444907.1 YqaE/Pmp3 family membrane protein [Lishizhenia sp.]
MKRTTLIALAAIVLASCSTSNEVVNNNRIQKRKYTKGWHVKKSTKFKRTKGTHEEELVAKTENTPTTQEDFDFKLPVKEVELTTDKTENIALENSEMTPVAETKVETTTPVNNREKKQVNEKIKPSLKDKLIAKAAVNKIEKALADKDLPKDVAAMDVSQNKEEASSSFTDDTELILLYVLAVLIPFLAVGIVTNWDIGQVLLNLLLCILCMVPGIIHAIIVVNKNA